MILVYSPANTFQKNTVILFLVIYFLSSPLFLDMLKKSYTFGEKKKFKYNIFFHYKSPLHSFPCFSTRKILDPCQDQHERGVGYSQRWKGETYNLLERRALPSCPHVPGAQGTACFRTFLLAGERVGRQLTKAPTHIQLCKERKRDGARSWPGLPASYFFYLRTIHQPLRRRHFLFGGLGSGHDNYLAIRILEITLSRRKGRS